MPFNTTGSEDLARALVFMKKFDAEHLDDRICELKVLQILCKLGFAVCKNCQHKNPISEAPQRMCICERCKKEIWITGGSFFDHVRKFKPYLASIGLLENGIILSASELRNVLSVTQSTSDKIYKKISLLVSEKMKGIGIEVETLELLTVVWRRCIETPAREHPIAEEIAMQKEAEQKSKGPESAEEGQALTGTEKSIFSLLSKTPVNFDDICRQLNVDCSKISAAIVGLELQDLVVRIPGDNYVKSDRVTQRAMSVSNSKNIKAELNHLSTRMIDFIQERFQGISRKYLQLYAALFWIYLDRKRWGPGAILQMCMQSRHIRRREIRDFVTPLTVNLIECSNV